jgi:hypothetical protein
VILWVTGGETTTLGEPMMSHVMWLKYIPEGSAGEAAQLENNSKAQCAAKIMYSMPSALISGILG